MLPLLVLVPPALAQAESGPELQLSAMAGALRVGDDFALDREARWTAVAGARVGWRPFPAVTLAAEAWLGDESLRGFGAVALFRPWAERAWPVDPAFEFGIERVDGGDEEDRGPGFVFGAGLERRSARWGLEAAARHHFLTVDEDEVDGVATGRDAELWEVRAAVSLLLGGAS
ncbi:MAG TPA: hypothetical protein VFS53_02465 [Gemmatimonadota bacterium]|nr:hypothetical protein [Gemmatimonadota bacterium]